MIPDTVKIKIDEPLKHSKLGITSIVIAILVWLYFFLVGLVFFYGGIGDSIAPRDSSFEWALIVVFTFLVAHLVVCSIGFIVGLVFGAVGLMMKEKKRISAAIGLILNIFPLLLEGIGIIYFFYL